VLLRPQGNLAAIDYRIVSTAFSTTETVGSAPDGCASFDAAVRTAAERQTQRLREFGLHVEASEHEAYRHLISRLSR
jgi:hypothetical protein